MSYTCPRCGMTSHNPNDEMHRYCGYCHQFEDDSEHREIRLTGDIVHQLFLSCLYEEEELTDGALPPSAVIGKGITIHVAFHPERLESARPAVVAMLSQLPDEFHSTSGGGWTFLNACMDKHGNQWTGLHRVMDELFTMGIALGYVTFPLPRDMWDALPGNVPYIVINLESSKER